MLEAYQNGLATLRRFNPYLFAVVGYKISKCCVVDPFVGASDDISAAHGLGTDGFDQPAIPVGVIVTCDAYVLSHDRDSGVGSRWKCRTVWVLDS